MLPGILAILFYCTHALYHLTQRHPEHLLWGCHLASLLIGIGSLAQDMTLVSIGVLWLCFGVPLWLIGLATGEPFSLTSALTHAGGLGIGLLVLQRAGLPDDWIWYQAALAFLALQQLCRLITPRQANVNMAFSIWPGWETAYRTYWRFWWTLTLSATAVFVAAEAMLRRMGW